MSVAPADEARRAPTAREVPVLFSCEGDELVGILHRAGTSPGRGVVLVVAGGPQYRAGAHRQFVLLARKLAAHGYPVLRFDLRGMGDSAGEHRGYMESELDVRAAVDSLLREEPSLREVVLFGECESASGLLFYAFRDSRVTGLALVNPWVRTEEGQARTYMKHYYRRRLFSKRFWKKVLAGELDVFESLRSFVDTARKARRPVGGAATEADDEAFRRLPLPVRTAVGLQRFTGKVLVLVSGRDYIAREFDEAVASTPAWAGLMDREAVTRHDMPDADHTFSRHDLREKASDAVLAWIGSW